jgi:6-phosphogluconolactonase/glucosamine-6-phosphate isomerase/deaminase
MATTQSIKTDPLSILLATGNSQLTFLAAMRWAVKVPWERVRVFHMDEYVTPQTPPFFLDVHSAAQALPEAIQ